jgi:hypothetical protein
VVDLLSLVSSFLPAMFIIFTFDAKLDYADAKLGISTSLYMEVQALP